MHARRSSPPSAGPAACCGALTPQQLILAYLLAATEISRRPDSAASTADWNERLRILQAANRHLSTEADLETLTRAARYPDVVRSQRRCLPVSENACGARGPLRSAEAAKSPLGTAGAQRL